MSSGCTGSLNFSMYQHLQHFFCTVSAVAHGNRTLCLLLKIVRIERRDERSNARKAKCQRSLAGQPSVASGGLCHISKTQSSLNSQDVCYRLWWRMSFQMWKFRFFSSTCDMKDTQSAATAAEIFLSSPSFLDWNKLQLMMILCFLIVFFLKILSMSC